MQGTTWDLVTEVWAGGDGLLTLESTDTLSDRGLAGLQLVRLPEPGGLAGLLVGVVLLRGMARRALQLVSAWTVTVGGLNLSWSGTSTLTLQFMPGPGATAAWMVGLAGIPGLHRRSRVRR